MHVCLSAIILLKLTHESLEVEMLTLKGFQTYRIKKLPVLCFVVQMKGQDLYLELVKKNQIIKKNITKDIIESKHHPSQFNKSKLSQQNHEQSHWPEIFLFLAMFLSLWYSFLATLSFFASNFFSNWSSYGSKIKILTLSIGLYHSIEVFLTLKIYIRAPILS